MISNLRFFLLALRAFHFESALQMIAIAGRIAIVHALTVVAIAFIPFFNFGRAWKWADEVVHKERDVRRNSIKISTFVAFFAAFPVYHILSVIFGNFVDLTLSFSANDMRDPTADQWGEMLGFLLVVFIAYMLAYNLAFMALRIVMWPFVKSYEWEKDLPSKLREVE